MASGGVGEYSVPNPSPYGGCVGYICRTSLLSGIVAGRDGNLWFVDVGQRKVGRMTPSGVITEFDVPGTNSVPGEITAGPDGNIWVAAPNYGAGPDWVLRITPAGDVTRFPVARAGADGGIDGIAAGPDGNIWFTDFHGDRMGRMTPAGVLTEFPLPPERGPRQIAAGPDGNVWFSESRPNAGDHNAIARITPAGKVTEFPLDAPDALHIAGAMVAGPDGNLWFADASANTAGCQPPPCGVRLDRITPSGEITKLPLLSGLISLDALAVGPDGNFWFTNAVGSTVGRISPKGAMRQFALPKREARPIGIAAGADGRLWFTENGVSRIASIGVTVPEVSLSSRIVNFGSGVGSIRRTVALTNTGDANLKIASATIAGLDGATFTIGSDSCSGRVVGVGATCRVEVLFKPVVDPGLRTAHLGFVDNATGSPQGVSLVAQLPDCKLPVIELSDPWSGHGKLLQLSSGLATTDPNGGFERFVDLTRTSAEPILYGQFPAYYDQAIRRWLPVGNEVMISPDGLRYAYTGPPQGGQELSGTHALHVVDAATGHDRVLYVSVVTDSGGVTVGSVLGRVLGFAPEGIYVEEYRTDPASSSGALVAGMWLVDPDTGAKRQILYGDGTAALVAEGAVWIELHDPRYTTQPNYGPYNEVLRRDLATGETTTWFHNDGGSLGGLAVAGGRLLVEVYDTIGRDFWIVSGPNEAERLAIAEPGEAQAQPFSGNVIAQGGLVADTHGAWLGTRDGIFLWTPRTGAVLVSDVRGQPAGKCA